MNTQTYKASAAAKVILCGEHAVVYGQPAIAVPLSDVRARATWVQSGTSSLRVHLPDVGETWDWPPGPRDHPLSLLIRETLAYLEIPTPGGELTVRSDIPVGGGLGSSAAIAVAVVRVLAAVAHRPLSPAEVSALAYKAETIWHGTPSGIDNTVIAYERPVWFVRGTPPEPFTPHDPFTLVVGDSGVSASTRDVVLAVRQAWQKAPHRYERLFQAIGQLVHQIRDALEHGRVKDVGPLLDENHRLLREMGVSSPVLDNLVDAARRAGALGAKLAGAGWGGNVIALVEEADAARVAEALRQAGAVHTFVTTVQGASGNGRPK